MSDNIDDRNRRLTAILRAAPVAPVLTIEDRAIAVPLARALVAGELTALEVTLRTPAYLALPNIICVGGSWVAPAAAVAVSDWATVTMLAREAARLTSL